MKHRSTTGFKWRRTLAAAAVLAVALSPSASALGLEKNETALNAHKQLFSTSTLNKLETGFSLIKETITPVTDNALAERYRARYGAENGWVFGTEDNLFSAMRQNSNSSAVVVPYTDLFGKKYTEPVKDAFNLYQSPNGNEIFAQHLLVDSSEKIVMDYLTFTMNESKKLIMKYMEIRDGRRVIKEVLLPEKVTMYNLTNAEINMLNVVNPPAGFMLNLADDTAFGNIYVDGDTLVSVNGTFNELNLVRGAAYIASSGNGTLNLCSARAHAALDEHATVAKAKFITRSGLLGDNWGDTLLDYFPDPVEEEDDDPGDEPPVGDYIPPPPPEDNGDGPVVTD